MRRTIKEKIREHVLRRRREGSLKPGDLVPSFHTLRQEFKTSYATVQGAIESLEKEGVVERKQGLGTFLSGMKPLAVEMSLCLSTFPKAEVEALLAEFCGHHGLYLDVTLRDVCELMTRKRGAADRKAIITQVKFFDYPLLGNLLDFSAFPDCDEALRPLKPLPISNRNVFLPFSLFPAQMGINRRIFNDLGLSEKLPHDFSWWDDYVAVCRARGVHPAAKTWPLHSLWCFEKHLPLLFALRLNETGDTAAVNKIPLFATSSGRRFLEMLKSYSTFRALNEDNPYFEKGNVGMSLALGSWIAVQHERRFGLASEDFMVVPYLMGDRKICNFELSGLMTFVPPDISPDERRRLWELLKILVSRDFQTRLAGVSGMVSVRNDIGPGGHPWNQRPDYAAFFPAPGDVEIYNNVFDPRVVAALSTLCEQFEDYGADASHILKDMDEKVRSIHEPT